VVERVLWQFSVEPAWQAAILPAVGMELVPYPLSPGERDLLAYSDEEWCRWKYGTDLHALAGCRYFDREGRPISFYAWTQLFENRPTTNYHLIGKAEVPGGHVSTVWLGLDHGFSLDPHNMRPMIFESLVFGGLLDGEMDRYSTAEEAREGHARLVRRACAATELFLFYLAQAV